MPGGFLSREVCFLRYGGRVPVVPLCAIDGVRVVVHDRRGDDVVRVVRRYRLHTVGARKHVEERGQQHGEDRSGR